MIFECNYVTNTIDAEYRNSNCLFKCNCSPFAAWRRWTPISSWVVENSISHSPAVRRSSKMAGVSCLLAPPTWFRSFRSRRVNFVETATNLLVRFHLLILDDLA